MCRDSMFCLIASLLVLAGPAEPSQAQFQRWILQFGTSYNEGATEAVSDGVGGFYVAGETHGSLANPNPAEAQDIWLALYDALGDRVWIRQYRDQLG